MLDTRKRMKRKSYIHMAIIHMTMVWPKSVANPSLSSKRYSDVLQGARLVSALSSIFACHLTSQGENL